MTIGAALIAVTALAVWWLQPAPSRTGPSGQPAQFTWTLPEGLSLDSAPVVAPDQGRFAFVGADASGRRLLCATCHRWTRSPFLEPKVHVSRSGRLTASTWATSPPAS